MKIRTKLLSTLAVVSLLPPAAAYVALIGNPRISFAVRMNEQEAHQGTSAQKLDTDLARITAAYNESLIGSIRIKAQPANHETAENQRRLANEALRSAVAAYDEDLRTIERSQSQQLQDASLVKNSTDRDAAESRESQLIETLRNSAPALQANIEKFVRLSDSSPTSADEYVQNVLQPQVRTILIKTVNDLASETEKNAGEYRRNISKSLQDSHTQTIVIVLLGAAVSIVLAANISRGVINPIHKLRNAAQQLGLGKMDTRVPKGLGDEFGELGDSFNTMANNLTKLMREYDRAQQELAKANERLQTSMSELESRNREAHTLGEMSDLLQSCLKFPEASGVIACSAQKLFPGFSGSVMVFSASRNILEAQTVWGPSAPAERVFGPDDCWALRRGHLHHSSSEPGAVRCVHFGAESRLPSLCTPLMAHGETLGVLCLVTEPNGLQRETPPISYFNVHLAIAVAGQAALSFANLKLRDKLRHQSIRDPLTGLFNRRYLDESIERELPPAIRNNRSLGIIMLDVDKFKNFNDMFGHDAGDTVLKELGDHLTKSIRRGDLACRYGGEEFTVVLPESSLENTRHRPEQLRMTFQQLSIKHRDIVLGKVTLSLGVAAFPEHGSTAAELLTAADTALFRAKDEGRDRVLIAEVAPTSST